MGETTDSVDNWATELQVAAVNQVLMNPAEVVRIPHNHSLQ